MRTPAPLRKAARLAALTAAAALLAAVAPAEGPAGECDRLAASRADPGRLADPVDFDHIDGPAAEAACRAAFAAEPGNMRAAYQLGRALDRQDKFDEARAAYRRASEAGFLPAFLPLGKLIELGLGSDANPVEAAKLYREALDRGLDYAAGELGWLYQQGLGVAADKAAAAQLYETAAAAGDPWAEVNLGVLLENGDGVPEDLPRAVALYRSAADKGNAVGEYNTGLFLAIGKGVPRDDHEALRFLERSAAQAYAPAWLALARHRLHAAPELRDEAEAERNYILAVASDDDDSSWRAANDLAWMWVKQGRVEEAADLVRGALQKAPRDDGQYPGLIDTASAVARAQGDIARAVSLMQEAIRLRPDHAPYRDRLGDLYAAEGKTAEARAEWEAALAMPPPDRAFDPEWDREALVRKLGK